MNAVEIQTNFAGGIDLLTERDSGNMVLILTGKPSNSLKFWKAIQDKAEQAISILNEKLEDDDDERGAN